MSSQTVVQMTATVAQRQRRRTRIRWFGWVRLLTYQPMLPGSPLKGPTMSLVIQPP